MESLRLMKYRVRGSDVDSRSFLKSTKASSFDHEAAHEVVSIRQTVNVLHTSA